MKKHIFYFLVLMCSSNLFAADHQNSDVKDINSIDQKELLDDIVRLYSGHLEERLFHVFDENEDALSESKNLFIMFVARQCRKGKSRNINISILLAEKLRHKKKLNKFYEGLRKIDEPEAKNIAKSLENALGQIKSKKKKSGLSSEKSSLIINSTEVLEPKILAEKITLLTYKYYKEAKKN